MKTIFQLFIICCFSSVIYSQTVIYTADFETDLDGWTQDAGGNFDWTRDSGGTPSSNTGPSSGASGSYYMFTEASSNYNNISNFESPSFDLTSGTSPLFTFYYHMYGSNMGSLYVDISTDDGATYSTNLWSQSGPVQTSSGAAWSQVNLDLTAYIGQTVKVRFRGLTGGSYRSDMAIDNVSVTVTYPNAEINLLGNGSFISDGDTTPTTIDDTNFGSIDTGSIMDKTFTIQNIGNLALNLSGTPLVAIIGDAAFTILTQPSTSSIASGGDLTFVVRFSPTIVSTVTAVVSIDNSDANENPYNFTIEGTGLLGLSSGPGGITSDLKLWLKADDGLAYSDGQSVSLWSNQGRGADATTNLPTQAPTYRDNASYNVNFNPVVDFDSNYSLGPIDGDYSYDNTNGDFLKGDDSFYTQDIFVVLIPDVAVNSSFGNMDLFCGDEDLSANTEDVTGVGYGRYSARFTNEVFAYCIGPTSSSSPYPGYGVADITSGTNYNNVGIINARNNTAVNEQELYYNANNSRTIQNDASDFSNVNNSRFWIGRSEAYEAATDARITEIITFTSRQNDVSHRPKIESYLAIKYGITLGVNGTSQDYVDSNGGLIWNQSTNTGFNYDIAGIGRDDDSELNQKQSKSVNTGSIVAIGLGEVASTNNTNTNSFNTNLDFLVWGNDNENFNTASEVSQNINLGGSTTTFIPVSRKWKIIESQNDVEEVVLSLNTSDLTSNISLAANEEYVLVVSESSNFATTDIIDVVPLIANGSNSEVWYDFDGTKYFTFGKATRVEEKRRIDFASGEFLLGERNLNLNTSNFTISAWVKNNTNGGSFISKGTSFDLKINGGNFIEIGWNGNSTLITSTNIISDSNWHHIAFIYGANTGSLYIDGVLDKSVGSLPNPVSGSHRFTIGAYYQNKSTITSFDGSIDEVRLWNNSLSVNEVRYIMNQEIEDFSTNVDGEIIPQNITKNEIGTRSWSTLQAYYDMNSFYGTTVEDNSSSKNWVRIKYLSKDKQVVDIQTAPLPYQSLANGNWDINTTWLNNTVQYLPNTSINGTMVDWNIVETDHNINTTRSVKLLGLKNNSNELSINSSNELNITHYLLLNGVIDLDGESQLVQTIGSDLDVLSLGYLERDQQGEGNRFRYNDWSSPVIFQGSGNNSVTPFTIANILKDGTNSSVPGPINFVGGYDGALGSPLEISDFWLYKYSNLPDGDYSAWTHIGSSGNLFAGQGFLMKGTGDPGAGDQNYVFEGKPNNGTINLTISGNYDYLVGNPYPSAIDGNQFINDNSNSITGTLYFWEHYGGDTHNLKEYQAGYGAYNLLGGVIASAHPSVSGVGTATKIPKQFIAVSQGFFVVGDADGGTIEFNNGQRTFVSEASTNSVFMKSEKSMKYPSNTNSNVENSKKTKQSRIRVGFDAPQIDHRQLLLGIDKNATNGVDWGYDAEIYEILNDDMYWVINDEKYVIQGIKKIKKFREIPIGIITKEGGLISIKIDTLENVSKNLKLYIKDKITRKTHNISKKDFNIQLEAGEYNDRFSLVFKKRKTHNDFNKDELEIKPNISMIAKGAVLEINKISNETIERIELYNMLGQPLKVWNKNINGWTVYLNHSQSSGMYIIKVNTNNSSVSKKIIIK